MALAGAELVHTEGKRGMDTVLEVAATSARANMKCVEGWSAAALQAAREVETLLHQLVALLHELPSDPVVASQRVVASHLEAYGKSLDLGITALNSWMSLVNEAVSCGAS
jgi:hypothetical protein